MAEPKFQNILLSDRTKLPPQQSIQKLIDYALYYFSFNPWSNNPFRMQDNRTRSRKFNNVKATWLASVVVFGFPVYYLIKVFRIKLSIIQYFSRVLCLVAGLNFTLILNWTSHLPLSVDQSDCCTDLKSTTEINKSSSILSRKRIFKEKRLVKSHWPTLLLSCGINRCETHFMVFHDMLIFHCRKR